MTKQQTVSQTRGTITIRGGRLVLPGSGIVPGDLQITDGRITAIGAVKEDAGEVVDARHLLVMPGVVDPQVHFRDPGATHKEDLRTGSQACAAGGVTSFLEMPNTKPATTTEAALASKLKRAAEVCLVNYGFFIGATKDNVDVQNEVENVPGIKVFMGSSTGDLLVDAAEDLDRVFRTGKRLIAVHAEDETRLKERAAQFSDRKDPRAHLEIRDVEAARIATERALTLSEKYQRRLHILHLSTAEELDLLRQRGKGNGRVTCEVTPQHLLLNAPEVYDRLGTRAQMNPPLRTTRHSAALWLGLREGLVDLIATDHAPHTTEEKDRPFGQAPSGLPGVETSLALMLDASHRGMCRLTDVIRWMCTAPAEAYNMRGKGSLQVGNDGDLVLVDLNRTERVGDRRYFTKSNWNPFEGMSVVGWPVMTVVGGQVVFRDNQVVDEPVGRAILFE